MDSRLQAKRSLRRGSHLLNAKENKRALECFLHALGVTSDYGDKTEAAYYLPRIRHCLALAHAALGDKDQARKNFERSLGLFEKNNYVGRARTMRDFGWFLFKDGRVTAGHNRVQGALNVLALDNERDERWEREQVATEGFLARFDAERDPRGVAMKLRQVDTRLRGVDKWIYELDNLQHLIPLLPLAESFEFRPRAVFLNERICLSADMRVLADDIVMGEPIHGIGGFMVRSTRRRLPF